MQQGSPSQSHSSEEPEFTKKIEICKLNYNEGRFDKVSNLPLILTESIASVQNVRSTVSVDLLDCDNLKLLDAASTVLGWKQDC